MTPLNGPHCKGVWWIHDGRLHTTTFGHGSSSTLASSLWTSSVWVRSGLLQALLGEVRRQSVTYRTWLLAIEQVYVFGVWTEMQPEYSQLRSGDLSTLRSLRVVRALRLLRLLKAHRVWNRPAGPAGWFFLPFLQESFRETIFFCSPSAPTQ